MTVTIEQLTINFGKRQLNKISKFISSNITYVTHI